jgi:hypothetical protein
MLQILDRKIKQMHEALGSLEKNDLSTLEVIRGLSEDGYYVKLDFSQNMSEEKLYNIVTLLIANIACMKDHLKAWCNRNSRSFNGDRLIDTNTDVAIIHDLWNIDKHLNLRSTPRSGFTPKIDNLKQALSLTTGNDDGSFAMFSMDPITGKFMQQSGNGGSVSLIISGDVIDENGTRMGDFLEICEKAVSAWEKELVAAGINIPIR